MKSIKIITMSLVLIVVANLVAWFSGCKASSSISNTKDLVEPYELDMYALYTLDAKQENVCEFSCKEKPKSKEHARSKCNFLRSYISITALEKSKFSNLLKYIKDPEEQLHFRVHDEGYLVSSSGMGDDTLHSIMSRVSSLPEEKRLEVVNSCKRKQDSDFVVVASTGDIDVSSVFKSPSKFVRMNLNPPVIFTMGSPLSEVNRREDEILHQVTLTKTFQMLSTPVTVEQFNLIMGHLPESDIYPSCPNCPATFVSWGEAILFCNELSKKFNLKPYYGINKDYDIYLSGRGVSILGGNGFRLPTESEWEYAARGGTKTPYPFDTNKLGEYSWYLLDSERFFSKDIPEVAKKKPVNGLYDMFGYVWEWVWDYYREYPNTSVIDPVSIASSTTYPASCEKGECRVIRGGCWRKKDGAAWDCRSALRNYQLENDSRLGGGFRVARTL